jgi:hypothetical protein
MELNKKDLPTLDFLLTLLVERDSDVYGDDLKDFEKYNDAKSDFLYSEFKRLMYFFKHFGCGVPKNDGGLSEWISPNLVSAQFKHSGGFEKAYGDLQKQNENKQLELDLAKSNLAANKLNKKIAKQNEKNEKFNKKSTIVNVIIGVLNVGLIVWQILKD